MVFSLLGVTIALAASGDADTTFGGDGLVTNDIVPSDPGRWDLAYGIAIQPDGRIILAGNSYIFAFPITVQDFAITRYNPNGSLDTTFSGDGRRITNFGGLDQAFEVVVQANDKIVAAGQMCNSDYTICDVALARYNSNGTLDTTFSGDGRQTSDFGGRNNGSLGGLAIQPDGKIVVAGYIWNGTDYDFAVYRYLSNGALDNTFSGDGLVTINFGAGRQDSAGDLLIQSNGKIVVVGHSGDANQQNNNFAIARLNVGGSLDTTFSADGRQTTNFGADEYAYDLALQTDGKIVAAGQKRSGSINYVALARYNADGSLDTAFNGTGRKLWLGATAGAGDVIVQPDGKIVVLWTAFHAGPSDYDFALVRLNSVGSFDTSFGGDGKVNINFAGDQFGVALARQPSDGRYVLGGYIHNVSQADFAVARVLP
jgi:uncharacterized delta-60 repeat protein